MKKLILLMVLAPLQMLHAEGYKTAGDGTVYSIASLADIGETNVIVYEHEPTPDNVATYELRGDITIAKGDKFVMDDGIVVRLAKDVTLSIEGEGDFALTNGSTFIGQEGQAAVSIDGTTATTFKYCHFQQAGLELRSEGATSVSHCTFRQHDGSTAAALYFISAGAESTIEDCIFEDCAKAAIGSAANASQPLTISGCTLTNNSTLNSNVPQINITAASKLNIVNCTINGNPEHTMVGGLGISNFMRYEADVTISGCTISNNRYGIGLVGPAAHITIEDNTLLNNRYETNPMNGGSGISLYDPYQLTDARITGNHIEGSLWGITVIGCKAVNAGRIDVEESDDSYNPGKNTFKDNGFDGQLYDLYNNSDITVYAQGNTWNVSEQTAEQIETVIFHQNDDPTLGEVVYMAGTPEGIDSLEALQSADVGSVFTLQGQRVQGMCRPGLYIVGGRKVMRR